MGLLPNRPKWVKMLKKDVIATPVCGLVCNDIVLFGLFLFLQQPHFYIFFTEASRYFDCLPPIFVVSYGKMNERGMPNG